MSWCDAVTADGSSCFFSPMYTMWSWNKHAKSGQKTISEQAKVKVLRTRRNYNLLCSTHSPKEAAVWPVAEHNKRKLSSNPCLISRRVLCSSLLSRVCTYNIGARCYPWGARRKKSSKEHCVFQKNTWSRRTIGLDDHVVSTTIKQLETDLMTRGRPENNKLRLISGHKNNHGGARTVQTRICLHCRR